jgi:hypothetical protein
MKIGRNQKCPCGSGTKYKKCCLKNNNIVPASVLEYQRSLKTYNKLSNAYRDLEKHLETFTLEFISKDTIAEALDEFFCFPDDPDFITEEIMERCQDLYRPWLLYNWNCLPDTKIDAENREEYLCIANAFLTDNMHNIDKTHKALINSMSYVPYSFWEVVDVELGKTVTLKNIMTGITLTALEKLASESLLPRHIIFGRVVSVENICMLAGMGRTIVPQEMKAGIIQLRKIIADDLSTITDTGLIDWELELRELYLDIENILYNPPKISNTDGDPLEHHKLVFEITDPDFVFNSLAPLNVADTLENMKQHAKTDAKGRILKADITWTKEGNTKIASYDNTIMGEIKINEKKLTIQVNSAERSEIIRKKVEKKLGSNAKFKVDVIEDMEAVMQKFDENSFQEEQAKHDELMKNPEIRKQVEQMHAKHWDSWIDTPLPALGNISPRNAMKSPDDKEALEALLYSMVTPKGSDKFLNELNKKGVEKVKKELGIK